MALAPGDAVILALPAPVAKALLPEITAPESFRAILNAHFKIAPPPGWPAILGVIGGTVEWLFAFENRLSVTISGADRLIDRDREDLARELWGEVAALTGLRPSLPAWQIVKERRATFAALPAEEAKRPGAETRWPNLRLAGDWTATGLPATIEGAIRSGNRAAESLVSKGLVSGRSGRVKPERPRNSDAGRPLRATLNCRPCRLAGRSRRLDRPGDGGHPGASARRRPLGLRAGGRCHDSRPNMSC